MSALNVAILQADLAWHDAARNRELFTRQIEALPAGQDLVVLPEMFTTGFTMDATGQAETMDGASVRWMADMAASSRATIAGSLVIREGDNYFNRCLLMQPDGNYVSYDKRHLFQLAGEGEQYSAGRQLCTAHINGFRVRPMVCYDLRFPVWSRRSERNDFHVLLYVANWPEARHQAWAALLRARAIENQCYLIGVNRSGTDGNGVAYAGGSAIIDFLGNDLALLDREPGSATASLDLASLTEFRERYPFHQDADSFSLHVDD